MGWGLGWKIVLWEFTEKFNFSGGMKNQYIRGESPKKEWGWEGVLDISRFRREVCKKERVAYVREFEEPS